MSQLVKSYVRGGSKESPQAKNVTPVVPLIMAVSTLVVTTMAMPGIMIVITLALMAAYCATRRATRPKPTVVLEDTEEGTTPAKKRRKARPKFALTISI